MSCVVGLALGKHRIMAGDRRVSYGDGHKYDRAQKVYKLKTGLVGFTGDVEPESKLITALRKAADPERASLPKGSYEALFFSTNGKIYVISDGKSGEMQGHKFASGAGYQYAHGAMWCHMKRVRPRNKKQLIELARIGVRAAIEFNNTCGGRVQIKYMEVA